ncbi:MAG: IS1 family transposase [Acidobacteria bacterium]|jgi:transposase-like protein|nr:IS1 family transposase [Acidobacteriota bacterium]
MNQECPSCETNERQIKTGRNRSGTQRMLCRDCGGTYTIEPKPHGYSKEVREKAVRMYVEGNNFRRIGRLLGVNHQSVVNWVTAYHEKIKQSAAVPKKTQTIEMDELWSFVGEKKTERIL